MTDEADLAVIGGGAAGLAAAWTGARAGAKTVLLERSDRLGGSVLTHRDDGYIVEGGPHALLVQDERLERFLRECGIWESAVPSDPVAAKRFVVRKGRPVALPSSPGSFLFGSFLPPHAKLRLLLEPFRHGSPPAEGDEAIGPWVGRHFGAEVREALADPFVSGIFAGDPEKISLRAAFPKLAEVAGLHPSLLRAAIRRARESRRAGESRYGRKMISFPGGLRDLIDQLSRKGGFAVNPGAGVDSIEKEEGGWRIRFRSGGDGAKRTVRAGKLVVAVPPHALAGLPFDPAIAERLAVFADVAAPPVTTFAVAYRRDQVAHPLDGFGVLAPSRERRKVLGVLFDSSLFPGRTPEGQVLLSAFLGGARAPDQGRLDTETCLRLVREECAALLGAVGDPVYWKSTFWPRAIPQYNLGYRDIVAVFDRIETAAEGLAFAGNARDGVSLGNCLLSGVNRTEGLLA
ncbi:MAG: protoporphyrinogen oxidase [Puniceicoccaceae bacterium]